MFYLIILINLTLFLFSFMLGSTLLSVIIHFVIIPRTFFGLTSRYHFDRGWQVVYYQVTKDWDVQSISNLGATTLRGHSFLKKKGHFLKIDRVLLYLLQSLGGARVLSAPSGSYVCD